MHVLANIWLVLEPVGQGKQGDNAAGIVFAVVGIGDEKGDEGQGKKQQEDVGDCFEGGCKFRKEGGQQAGAVEDEKQEDESVILAGVAEQFEKGRHPEGGDGGGVDVGEEDDLRLITFGDEDLVFEQGFEGKAFGLVAAGVQRLFQFVEEGRFLCFFEADGKLFREGFVVLLDEGLVDGYVHGGSVADLAGSV